MSNRATPLEDDPGAMVICWRSDRIAFASDRGNSPHYDHMDPTQARVLAAALIAAADEAESAGGGS